MEGERIGGQLWLAEGIRALWAGMELCWFIPWAALFLGGWMSPGAVGTFAASAMFAAVATGRVMAAVLPTLAWRNALGIAGAGFTALLTVRFGLYGSYPPPDARWLQESARSLALAWERFPPEITILALSFYLWWRGMSIGSRSLTFEGVAFAFRLGVVMLLVATPAMYLADLDGRVLVGAYFFLGLCALALGRIREAELPAAGRGYWVGVALGASALVMAVGLLASRLYSLAGFETAFEFLRPLLAALERRAFALLVALLRPLDPLLQWLVDYFASLAKEGELVKLTPPPAFGEGVRPERVVEIPPLVAMALKAFGLFLLVAVSAFVVWLAYTLALRRPAAETSGLPRTERERAFPKVPPASRVRSILEAAKRRVRLGRRSPADPVRTLYLRLLELAAERGYPREPAQTPYEYLPTLQRAFPGLEEELRELTDAYVPVRYGGRSPSPEHVAKVRTLRSKFNVA